jgi:predicted methyltransferase
MEEIREIETKDGSITFHNEEYGEAYHSLTGAEEEAREKYAKPANIKPKNKILDICFGLGYNSAAALDITTDIEITAIEKDPNILKKTLNLKTEFKHYNIIKETIEGKQTQITLFVDDARKVIKTLPNNQFDIVFLDPFSPKKCPELWTQEFFKDINKSMKQGAKLFTYSCARVVRDNLKATGFKVSDGPSVGRWAPSTIAEKL